MSISKPQPLRRFVRAGAGAGKTYNLTREVVKLALQFHAETGQWPKTVLTTFTRKATQELKERMLLYCLEEKEEALDFVQSTSYLNITTMHGLLNRFLSQYGFGAGLPSKIKIVDGQQATFWKKQILRQMISDYSDNESLQNFNFSTLQEHLKAYESVYWTGHALPLATEGDFEKVYQNWLASKGDELGYWLDLMIGETPGPKWDDYFVALKGLKKSLDTAKPWAQWHKELQSHEIPKRPRPSKDNPGLSKEIKKDFDGFFKKLKETLDEPSLSTQYWPQVIQVLGDFKIFADDFMSRLIEKKKIEGALEPNDLEYFSLKLLQERPELVDRFSQDVDAWFIDEFQDTSPLQMNLLEPMIGDSSCYIVGDPQQSIYLFRGSRSEVFFEKGEKMAAEGANMDPLGDNYRSQENLLQFFNQIFPAIHQSFTTMNPKVEAIVDQPAVEITHVTSGEKNDELHHLTEELSSLMQAGVSAKDICILTRTHKQSDDLQKTLMGLGFPVISHSSDKFYQRREVIDGLALLKFLVNPWDDKNLMILMRSPWMGLSDQNIVNIIGDTEKTFWPLFKTYFQELGDSGPGSFLLQARDKVESMGYAWVFRRLLIQLGLLDYTYQVDTTGRREANLWKLLNIVERNAREPGASLLQLIQQGHFTSSLEDFGDSGDASSPVEPNKIHLMTVHASKGLQYDHVFIPYMEKKPRHSTWMSFAEDSDQEFWSFRMPLADPTQSFGGALEKLIVESTKEKELQESLRVFYVAATRAKKKLYLSWSGKPGTDSWAEKLMQCEDQWRDNPFVHFKEVEEQEARAFQETMAVAQVSAPFDKTVQRFSLEEVETKSRREFFGDWDAIKKGQQTRREGVVLHQVFESLKFHSVEETKKYCGRWLPNRAGEMEKAIDYIYSQKQIPLAEIIKQGFVEWGYQRVDEQGTVTEKRVDLWSVVEDTLWVVDYKTGSVGNKDKAFTQMSEYAETLKSFLDWKKEIKMAAVYPFSEKIFDENY